MNRLQYETSPYLLQHRDNPVDWWSWGPLALEEAKLENKPILVSVGYSTCHWCHVMAHESFDNEATAQIMNAHFICIKIDREERPDLDHIFMDAVQMMGVHGGWPLHIFLTPNLKPFFGGTYFPPMPKYGRPSWNQILLAIHDAFQKKSTEIVENGQAIFDQLSKNYTQTKISIDSNLTHTGVVEIVDKLQTNFDYEEGGFGSGQKFPNTIALQLFLQYYAYTNDPNILSNVVLSLKKMCTGGMFDHIGGGFSRYTVDRQWNVPHFEKMLYDHALIMPILAQVYCITKDEAWLHFLEKSFYFFERDLRAPNGLFFSAMDADSEGEEGKFYTWTKDQITNILGNDAGSFFQMMELIPFEHGEGQVLCIRKLHRKLSKQEFQQYKSLGQSFDKLFKFRSTRIPPSIDVKNILSWNALMVVAYTQTFKYTGNQVWKIKAEELLQNILRQYSLNDNSQHYARIVNGNNKQGHGFLEDYAYLLYSILNVFTLSGDEEYLSISEPLLEYIEDHFLNGSPVFQFVSKFHSDSLMPFSDLQDHSLPNANAIMMECYRLLFMLTDKAKYEARVQEMWKLVSKQALDHPFSLCSWISSFIEYELGGLLMKSRNLDELIQISSTEYFPFSIFKKDGLDQNDWIQLCTKNLCTEIKAEAISNELALWKKKYYHFEK
ncbi:MAG: thioredoxin domain-containing protein [Bacteroidota bacterium]|nr:thioredoxin domain-containing protein [Bacteroidota bacterium]